MSLRDLLSKNAYSAPNSAHGSPRTHRSALKNVRKRFSAPFSVSGGNGSEYRLQQPSIASRVPDSLHFFFAPQVTNPSEDIDALTVIGKNVGTLPYVVERWFAAREQTHVSPPREGFDVDEMVHIGVENTPMQTKGFDVDNMLSAGEMASSPLAMELGKRRLSFPPGGLDRAAVAAVAASRENLRAKAAAEGLVRAKSKMSMGKLLIADESDDDDAFGRHCLIPGESCQDFDSMINSAPEPEVLLQGIERLKTREKVKDVLNDVEEYISQNPLQRRETTKVKRMDVDVDQLVEISQCTQEPKGKSRNGSIFSRSRRGSIFQGFLPGLGASQNNLAGKKINPAITVDLEAMNAVYYPWTEAGASANDLHQLLELCEKKDQERILLAPEPVKALHRQDIDTVVLAGSHDDLSPSPADEDPVGSPYRPARPSRFQFPHQREGHNIANSEAMGIGTAAKSLHRSAPTIPKAVDFILPSRSALDVATRGAGIQPSRSDASLALSAAHASRLQSVVKRDIDFLFELANKEPAVTVVKEVVDRAEKRDFNELINLADSILELNEATQARQVRSFSLGAIEALRRSVSGAGNGSGSGGRSSVAARISVVGGGGRSSVGVARADSNDRRVSVKNGTVGRGGEPRGTNGRAVGDRGTGVRDWGTYGRSHVSPMMQESLRDIVEQSLVKAFSESSVNLGGPRVVRMEPGKYAAQVKEVGVKLTDFDELVGSL